MIQANPGFKPSSEIKMHMRVYEKRPDVGSVEMIVEFEDGQDPKAVMKDVLKNCKKVEDDCEIYL